MASGQFDLFRSPVVPGLDHTDDLITQDEEAALITRIGALDLAPFQFQGWTGKRQTTSFGWHYDFDTAQFGPTTPVPEWLLPLRTRAAAFAGLPAHDLVQALVTRYDPGAVIGWHRDRPVFEHIVGVSLGVAAALRLRRRTAGGFDRARLPLEPRSVYHLSGEARHA